MKYDINECREQEEKKQYTESEMINIMLTSVCHIAYNSLHFTMQLHLQEGKLKLNYKIIKSGVN